MQYSSQHLLDIVGNLWQFLSFTVAVIIYSENKEGEIDIFPSKKIGDVELKTNHWAEDMFKCPQGERSRGK